MRKRVVLVALLAAAVVVSQTLVGAQGARVVEAQFRAAQYKIEVQGDVAGAMADYRRIADGADRTAAARALLEIGRAYQRFGGGDPADVLARLRRDFSDQPAVVAEATAALSMAATSPQAASARQLTTGTMTARDISPDGRVALVMVANGTVGDIGLQDVTTGETTVVVAGSSGPTGRVGLSDPVFANDGRQIAYRMVSNRQAEPRYQSTLHVVEAKAGATPRAVAWVPPDWSSPGYPLVWSADGRALLVYSMVTGEGGSAPPGTVLLNWISVDDGSSTPVAALEQWREVYVMSWPTTPRGLSPDGTLFAFSAIAREGSDDRALFVLDVRDGSETPVVQMAGQHFDPVWTPDGGHLLFASDRSGKRALWAVPMRAGRAAGEPFQVKPDIGRIVGISQAGDLFEEQSYGGGQQVFMADLPATGNGRIGSYFQGEGVAWAQDNQSLAYFRRDGQNALSVVVRSLATGEERTFSREGLGASQLRWVDGSSSLLVQVNAAGDGGRQGGSEYLLDTRTGEFTWLLARNADGVVRYPVADVSADKSVYMLTRDGRGGPLTGVVAFDIETRTEKTVSTFSGLGNRTPAAAGAGAGIAVSPDGATLVIKVPAEEADPPRTFLATLFAVDVAGGAVRELYGPFPISALPSITRWTPDGQGILFFVTQRNGDWRLMRISPTGGEPVFAGLDSTNLQSDVRLPRLSPGSPLSLDISPDGTKVAFGANTSVTHELWVHDGLASRLGTR